VGALGLRRGILNDLVHEKTKEGSRDEKKGLNRKLKCVWCGLEKVSLDLRERLILGASISRTMGTPSLNFIVASSKHRNGPT